VLQQFLIEKVSGQSYFDYVRENLYKPAGMTNTDCYETDQDTPNLAIGYTRERASRPWKNNL
jgi:D-alanyl-D-alanine carboxypeptidase